MNRRVKYGTGLYRGMAVDPEWARSFLKFYFSLGPRPPGKTLERKNNLLGYIPGNVTWATPAEQARNRGGVRLSPGKAREIRESLGTQRQIAEQFGVNYRTVQEIKANRLWRE